MFTSTIPVPLGLRLIFPFTFVEDIVFPFICMFPIVADPVTPKVPPTVALLVTAALLSVAAPDVLNVESEVAPVTPRVPPTVALVVTAALFNVANPVVLSVVVHILPVFVIPAVVVAPLTPRFPPTVALFVTAALLSVAAPEVLNVVSEVAPVTPSVPPIVALFVTSKPLVALTSNFSVPAMITSPSVRLVVIVFPDI